MGVRGSVCAAPALAFAVALRMRAAGRGGSEDEVEEVDESEDEEEVVDAGWAVMRAGLWAAASAAATAGRMEGMSRGCRLGAGGWGGPVVTWRPGGPILSAAAGEGGAGLWPSPSGLGWARVLQCPRSCGLASAGGNSSRGLRSGAGGGGPGSSGVCAGGVGGPLGGVGVPRGAGLLSAGVCGLSSVGGGEGCPAGGCVAGVCWCSGRLGRPVSRGRGVRAMVGVCGSPVDAFPWGAWPRDAAVTRTSKQAGKALHSQGHQLRSCHETKRFRILATLQQGNKSMYSNTSGYVHMGLRLDWGEGTTGQ